MISLIHKCIGNITNVFSTIPWAYHIEFVAIFVRTLLKDNISLVLILQRLYRSKNQKYTKIHHFDPHMDHSRNQPTFSTIAIQTNYTLTYHPINLFSFITDSTSQTTNVLLIRLFHIFRIFLKTARRLFQYSVFEIAPKINFFSEVLLV